MRSTFQLGTSRRLACLAGVALAGCDDGSAPESLEKQGFFSSTAPRLPPLYGEDAGLDATQPALTQYRGEPSLEVLSEVERCRECHREVVETWEDSPHAQASFNNPWYRASVDAFRESQGHQASRFCAGCHDPLLLASKAMDRAVEATTPHATAGVTCLVCHSIQAPETAGRAGFLLDTSPIPYPRANDPASLQAHRKRLAGTSLRSPTLCGSCHRAQLGKDTGNAHAIAGMDDLGPYASSAYAGSFGDHMDFSVSREDCISCHMKPMAMQRTGVFSRDGVVASHRMPGGQTALASRRPAQLAETQGLLRQAVTVDIAALVSAKGQVTRAPTRFSAQPGERVQIEEVLFNQGAGHHFPGGVRDTQDTWVSLSLEDKNGCLLAGNGLDEGDAGAHRLASVFADPEGVPETLHRVDRFAIRIADHTVPPRDARLVRYQLTVPAHGEGPYALQAEVRHRRHQQAFHDFVCTASETPRGASFQEHAAGVDGCAKQPVTVLATTRLSHTDAFPPTPQQERLYRLALAERHQLAEFASAPLAALDEAAALAEDAEDPLALSRIALLRAQVLGSQGRVAAAQAALSRSREWLQAIEDDVVARRGAVAQRRAEAQALRQAWRFAEARPLLEAILDDSPRDTQAYRDLAQTLGSLGLGKRALWVSQQGLDRLPYDSQLLRSQAQALRRLHSSHAKQAAEAAWDYREADHVTDLRVTCADRSAACGTVQEPIPTYTLDPTEDACVSP